MNHKHPNICYFCGIPLDKTTITREHVPPKCFFPKGQKVDLITVPSCKEHNGGKSGDDEYLWQMISINILANEEGQTIATDKGLRSIFRNNQLTTKLADNARIIYIKEPNKEHLEPAFAFKIDFDRINKNIIGIFKAIYFYEFNKVFFGHISMIDSISVYIDGDDCIQKNEILEKNRANLKEIFFDVSKFGKNQNIFYYQILHTTDFVHTTIIRLCFYGNIFFTAMLKDKPKAKFTPLTKAIRSSY